MHNFQCVRIYFETAKISHQQKRSGEKDLWLLQFAIHWQRSHNVHFYLIFLFYNFPECSAELRALNLSATLSGDDKEKIQKQTLCSLVMAPQDHR